MVRTRGACFDRGSASWLDEQTSALLDAMPIGLFISRSDGTIRYSNPACQRMLKCSSTELLGRYWSELIDARDWMPAMSEPNPESGTGQPRGFEVRLVGNAGTRFWVGHRLTRLQADRDDSDLIHTIEDISDRMSSRRADQALRRSLQIECARARVTLECIGDAVISTDVEGRVTYLNPVAEQLTGWSHEAACGQPFDQVFKVINSHTRESARNPAAQAMQAQGIIRLAPDSMLSRPDGTELAVEDSAAPILDDSGQLTGAVVVFRDRRLSRESTEKMAHLARHDALTGLPNRLAFTEYFEQAIRLAKRHRRRLALLFIDLDRFKLLNDHHGHSAGDKALQQLARALEGWVRDTDLVGRQGGDEFVVLLNELTRAEDAGKVAEKLQAVVARSPDLKSYSPALTMSIGISVYPDHGRDLDRLMHCADIAMYHAKLDPACGYCVYRSDMERATVGSNFAQVLQVTRNAERHKSLGSHNPDE
jgi:diguanylate cyclase (GGDEF)-like protein/PAS domain S-box-containing protein